MSAAYSFVSRWRIAASAERCGQELDRMLVPSAVSWWHGVSVVEAPDRMRVGEQVSLLVRSPLGYRIRVVLTVTEWRPGRMIAARSSGDLRGRGSIVITDGGEGDASVLIRWDVMTERPWMTIASPILRPVFRAAHASVMRAGERGLRRAVQRVD